MNREDIRKLALDLARDLMVFCSRKPDTEGVNEILRLAAHASSWHDLLRQYCRLRKEQEQGPRRPEGQQKR